jgi:hypothetical protein
MMAASERIFEPGERTNARPMRHTENLYDHLSRRGGPGWDNVRALVDDWFARVPETPAPSKGRLDLLAKLRSRKSDTWMAGFWELYLHESLRRAGYEVEIEPEIEGSSKHPDFFARGHGHEFYVEAVVVTAGPETRQERRRAHLYDYLNDHPHQNFFIGLEIEREGTIDVPMRNLVRDATRWLDSLDPDATTLDDSVGWQGNGWLLRLRPAAKKPEARMIPSETLIGIYPMQSGSVDISARIRNALRSKASRYGRLNRPYLVALTASTIFADDYNIAQALLGPEVVQFSPSHPESSTLVRARDGLLMRRNGPQNKRVSGFVFAWNVSPTTLMHVRPQLWLNPWAPPERRLTAPLPWDRVVIDGTTGVTANEPTDFDTLAFFDLPADWPGYEERPFGWRRTE